MSKKVLSKAIVKSFVRLAGELANVGLKSMVAVFAAVKTLEFLGILVKY